MAENTINKLIKVTYELHYSISMESISAVIAHFITKTKYTLKRNYFANCDRRNVTLEHNNTEIEIWGNSISFTNVSEDTATKLYRKIKNIINDVEKSVNKNCIKPGGEE